MDKIKRNERLGALTRILTETPNRIHTLGEFCELFGAAKSTVSEDIDLLASSFERFDLGRVETVAGAAGGVRYRAIPSPKKARAALEKVAARLAEPRRMLPGGFLYTSDISAESDTTRALGEILAAKYYDKQPHFVLTMETKGIPIALMTAHMLDVPLVIMGKAVKPVNLGTRASFADIAATVAQLLNVELDTPGESFAKCIIQNA